MYKLFIIHHCKGTLTVEVHTMLITNCCIVHSPNITPAVLAHYWSISNALHNNIKLCVVESMCPSKEYHNKVHTAHV